MNKREEEQMLEELHRRMAESFDQWCEENKNKMDPPTLDLSFMEKNPELPDERKDSGDDRWHWFNLGVLRNAAAVFLMVIVLSSAMAVWINSNSAQALKFRIEKLYHETANHYYSTGENGNRDDNVIYMKATDLKDFEIITKRIPDLLIPENLPKGYTFFRAEAEYWENGNWTCSISYLNPKGDRIGVVEGNVREESELTSYIEAEEMHMENGRTIYYVEETDQIRGLFFIEDNVFVQVSGMVEKEELLQVENSM